MTAAGDNPPVLVLGASITALGVTRIFGRAGIPVYVSTGPNEVVRHSRWFRSVPGPAYAGAGLSAYLAQLPVDRAVLMPCSDHATLDVAQLGEALLDRFPRSVARPEALESLLDKAKFRDLVEVLDIPRPRTYWLRSAADLDAIPDDLVARGFLKPHDSQAFFARFGVKGFRTASRDDARQRYASLAAEGLEVVLQEYVAGPPDNHYLVDGYADRTGRIRAVFGRRRLRMYPLDFGNSCYMRSVPLWEVREAVDSLAAIVRHLGYRGIFSAEFKRDSRDGALKILEVNVRPWWYVEFAARCGVDVCRMAYEEAVGRDPGDVADYAVGRRLVYPYYDFFAGLTGWRAGRLSAARWVGSWVGAIQPVFTLDDPSPSLHEFGALVRRHAARRLRPRVRT